MDETNSNVEVVESFIILPYLLEISGRRQAGATVPEKKARSLLSWSRETDQEYIYKQDSYNCERCHLENKPGTVIGGLGGIWGRGFYLRMAT